MKIKKPGSLTTLGKVFAVILGIIMVVFFYLKHSELAFVERILYGLVSCLIAFLGAGLFYLAIFVVFYVFIKISNEIFHGEEGEKDEAQLDHFTKLSNPIVIMCLIASYVSVFINM